MKSYAWTSAVHTGSKFFHRDLRTVRAGRTSNSALLPPEAAMLMRVMITQGLLPDTVRALCCAAQERSLAMDLSFLTKRELQSALSHLEKSRKLLAREACG